MIRASRPTLDKLDWDGIKGDDWVQKPCLYCSLNSEIALTKNKINKLKKKNSSVTQVLGMGFKPASARTKNYLIKKVLSAPFKVKVAITRNWRAKTLTVQDVGLAQTTWSNMVSLKKKTKTFFWLLKANMRLLKKQNKKTMTKKKKR